MGGLICSYIEVARGRRRIHQSLLLLHRIAVVIVVVVVAPVHSLSCCRAVAAVVARNRHLNDVRQPFVWSYVVIHDGEALAIRPSVRPLVALACEYCTLYYFGLQHKSRCLALKQLWRTSSGLTGLAGLTGSPSGHHLKHAIRTKCQVNCGVIKQQHSRIAFGHWHDMARYASLCSWCPSIRTTEEAAVMTTSTEKLDY